MTAGREVWVLSPLTGALEMESGVVRLRHCIVLSVVFHVGLIAIPVSPSVRSLHTEAVLLVMDSRVTAVEDDEAEREERDRESAVEHAPTTFTKDVTRQQRIEPELTETPPSPEAPEMLSEPKLDDIASSLAPESREARPIELESPPALASEPTSMPEPDVDGLPPVGAGSADAGDAPAPVPFGSDWGPRFLKQVMPAYPARARRLGKQGNVVLKLTIDENGELIDVEVIERAGFGFDEEAVAAAKRSTYRPAVLDGKPIACEALFPIRFELR